jgi:hypothetical protein
MAYQEVGGQKKYFKYRDCEIGQLLVRGEYSREIMGKYGVQYEFLNEDGEIHVLNGSGQLKYKMDFIREGDMVEITYEGEIELTKGAMAGKSAHQFKILRDGDASPDHVDEEKSTDDEFDNLDELPF